MLFTPFSLKDMTLKNRVVMPPMCQYKAGTDGKPTDWHLLHYGARAVGQVGLIIVEATGITPGGRISEHDLGLWNEQQAEALRQIVETVHAHGSKIAVQLNHAGRKSTVADLTPLAPSALAFDENSRVPQVLSVDEIADVVEAFALAAKRAVAAGVDSLEVHAAHGYLINQFLSPLTNKRSDAYGGPAVNRARILAETVAAVRSEMPAQMPLIVRVSAHDYEPGGCREDDVAELINLTKDQGIDLVHVSSGAVTPTAPRAYPGYQLGFALRIKELTGLPVIGGGLVTEPAQAAQCIKAGLDLVFLGRELLRSPYWPLQAAHRLGQEVSWPQPYERARF